jgi:hypothetical protein
VVRAAVARKETAEDDDRRPDWPTRTLAALDPTSFVDRGTATEMPVQGRAKDSASP